MFCQSAAMTRVELVPEVWARTETANETARTNKVVLAMEFTLKSMANLKGNGYPFSNPGATLNRVIEKI